MSYYTFEIDGKPYAQKRHRMTKTGRTYSPPENLEFRRRAQAAMKNLLFLNKREAPLFEKGTPVKLYFQFCFPKPKTDKRYYRAKKPDIDNLVKAIMDAGNGILWHDDSQVASITAHKFHTEKRPTTRVEIDELVANYNPLLHGPLAE